MSYEKHRTKCVVLKSKNFGEADKVLFFLTKEFGVIKAVSKSVRKDGAKLKSFVEPGTLLFGTFVKGKHIWRFIEAESMYVYERLKKEEKQTVLQLLKLVYSLTDIEEKNQNLFDIIQETIQKISSFKDLSSFECVYVFKILDSLGYGTSNEKVEYIKKENISDDVLSFVNKDKGFFVSYINKALKETGLLNA